MEPDVRWVQRLANLKLAVQSLREALALPEPDKFQRAGIVQYFEMAFELSWNAVKDYLESQGFEQVSSPRAALKKAFEHGILQDGHGWLQGLEDRNLTSHTYNEGVARQVEDLARYRYLPLFMALISELESRAV